MSHIQHTLKSQLESHGLTAGKLAQKAGVPVSSIKNILQGKVDNPRYDTINALASALGVEPGVLMLNGTANAAQSENTAIDTTFQLDDFEQVINILAPLYRQHEMNLKKSEAYRLFDEIYEYVRFLKQQDKGNISDETLQSFISWSLWQRKT